MAELNNQELIEKFERLLTSVHREGIDKLLAYIRKSDFYSAPASTRFHSCHDGGLLEHSLNVYCCLIAKKNNDTWSPILNDIEDDKIPFGHGEKSVMMIEEFIKLKPVERYAIRWHMAFTEPKEYWNTMTAALKKYPVILALHQADLEATYLMEEEE